MSTAGVVLSIQVGPPRSYGAEGAGHSARRSWTTGIFKEPVRGPVRLGRTNLEGDGQADLRVHGGPDKAVLAYSAEHYPVWRLELGLTDFPPGAFGENFTVARVTEVDVCIGDVFALGDARLQVSQPRSPCWRLARRWGLEDLPARVLETGRTGWYLRVLEEGTVRPDPLTLIERPCPEWTVARANDIIYAPDDERDHAAEAHLAACPFLAQGWRRWLARRLR